MSEIKTREASGKRYNRRLLPSSRAFLFLPARCPDFSPERLIGGKYSFFRGIVLFEIGRHPFRMKVKNLHRYAQDCADLLNNLITWRSAPPFFDIEQIGIRDVSAIAFLNLCRHVFSRELERFAARGDVLSETRHFLGFNPFLLLRE